MAFSCTLLMKYLIGIDLPARKCEYESNIFYITGSIFGILMSVKTLFSKLAIEVLCRYQSLKQNEVHVGLPISYSPHTTVSPNIRYFQDFIGTDFMGF